MIRPGQLAQWLPRAAPPARTRGDRPCPQPRRVVVICNPVSRHCRQVNAALRAALRARGAAPPTVLPTSVDQPGAEQARRALELDADRVVVIGGDGTLRAVAGVLAGGGVPIGIIPTGTGNLLARNLGLSPRGWRAAVQVALGEHCAAVDTGLVHCLTPSGRIVEPMIAMTGVGRDALAVAAASSRLKATWGWGAYAGAGLVQAARGGIDLSLAIDGSPARELRAWTVLVTNLPRVPAGVVPAARARADDGLLDVLVVGADRPVDWMPIAAKGVLHFSAEVPGLAHSQAQRVSITLPVPGPVQIDGDVVDAVEQVRVEVLPGSLLVMVPGHSAASR